MNELNVLIIGDKGDMNYTLPMALGNEFIVTTHNIADPYEAIDHICIVRSIKIFYHVAIFCQNFKYYLWKNFYDIPLIKLYVTDSPNWVDCRNSFLRGAYNYIDRNTDNLCQVLRKTILDGLTSLKKDTLPRPIGLGRESGLYNNFIEMLQDRAYTLSRLPGEHIAFIGNQIVGHSKDPGFFQEMDEKYPLFPIKYTSTPPYLDTYNYNIVFHKGEYNG